MKFVVTSIGKYTWNNLYNVTHFTHVVRSKKIEDLVFSKFSWTPKTVYHSAHEMEKFFCNHTFKVSAIFYTASLIFDVVSIILFFNIIPSFNSTVPLNFEWYRGTRTCQVNNVPFSSTNMPDKRSYIMFTYVFLHNDVCYYTFIIEFSTHAAENPV